MRPFILSKQISRETLDYFENIFCKLPNKISDNAGLTKTDDLYQVVFKTGAIFFVQLEKIDVEWVDRLYSELGINGKIYPTTNTMAAITSNQIIQRHSDFSNDETVILNVGILGVSSTKTVFYYPDETITLEYEPTQAFVFDPKIEHEVKWRNDAVTQFHRVSLTLKFFDSFDNFANNLC